MLSKILKAFPVVFSLRHNSDYGDYNNYSGFHVPDSAAEMMRDNWAGVGCRMKAAIDKVGRDVEKENTE
ncbi:hypothetical protein [Massilia violaceinigra]|uniref:hypothetical protein n=1 Tax=Massilia violaceinigra TaxID=2045208 RepID=UPI0012FD5660|nr:hypothetical protein [Massilia violaceinigra]